MNIVLAQLEHIVTGKTADSLSKTFGDTAISAFFIRLLVLLAFWSYAAVWTTGYLRALLWAIAIPLILLGIYAKPFPSGRLLFKILSIGALLFAIYEVTTPIPGVIILLNFACVILILQLLLVDSIRAANGVMVLSMMIILAVAAMNVNFIFPMVLIPYLISFYMVLKELAWLRHMNIATTRSGVKSPEAFSLRKFFVNGIATFVIFSCFWLVIFYLIPRNESFGMASETSRRRLKGFSDTMDIVDAGMLEDNPAVIMRVVPLDEKSLTPSILRRIKNKLLRGAAFARYDHGKWERGTKRRWLIDLRSSFGEIVLLPEAKLHRDLHRLEVMLENIDPPVVFVPEHTVSVNCSVPFLAVEEDSSIYFTQRSVDRRRYVVNLIADAIEPEDVEVTQILADKELHIYGSKAGIPNKVLALAQNLASGTTTINARIEKAIGFIHKNCSYSLRQLPSAMDPVEDFLFAGRSGACEHFATALVLLLRAMDIPARPVGGYTMGDWNEIGKFFTIRQRHAHAWVEVFFPGSGWIPVDPTPTLEEVINESGIGKFLTTLWETYEGYWFSYVYNFDNRVQAIGFRKISLAFFAGVATLGEILFNKFVMVLLVLIAILVYLRWPMWLRRVHKRDSWIPLWYCDWEKSQQETRFAWETPADYHKRLLNMKKVTHDTAAKLSEVEKIIDEIAFSASADHDNLKLRAIALLTEIKIIS